MSNHTAKGGNIILRDVRTPGTVSPGQPLEVDVLVSNGANLILPTDPDAGDGGYRIEVVLIGPSGNRQTKSDTIGITEVGTVDRTYTFTTTAPEYETTADVKAWVRLPGSGERTREMLSQVVVNATQTEGADTPGSRTQDDPEDDSTADSGPDFGGDAFGGDGGGDGDNPIPDPFSVGDNPMVMIGVAVVVLYLLSDYADAASRFAS